MSSGIRRLLGFARRGGARVTALDTFNRADNASSLGNADSGQAWTANTGTWGISSNTAYSSTVGVAVALLSVNAMNGTLVCTAARPASNTGLYFRSNSGGTAGYRIRADGTNVYLEATYNAFTVLAQAAYAYGTGARTFTVRGIGTAITVSIDGVVQLSYTEATPQTGTYCGIYKNSAQTTGQYYENFSFTRA